MDRTTRFPAPAVSAAFCGQRPDVIVMTTADRVFPKVEAPQTTPHVERMP